MKRRKRKKVEYRRPVQHTAYGYNDCIAYMEFLLNGIIRFVRRDIRASGVYRHIWVDCAKKDTSRYNYTLDSLNKLCKRVSCRNKLNNLYLIWLYGVRDRLFFNVLKVMDISSFFASDVSAVVAFASHLLRQYRKQLKETRSRKEIAKINMDIFFAKRLKDISSSLYEDE